MNVDIVQKDVSQPLVTHRAPTRMVRDSDGGVFGDAAANLLTFILLHDDDMGG